MREKRVRFGEYIKKIRLDDSRELRQSDVAQELGISTGMYGDIENNRRRPFDHEKINKFIELFDLREQERARMFDLASREHNEVPADLEDLLLYEKIGEMARVALREFQGGNLDEEDWKALIRKAEMNKKEREDQL